MLQSLTGALAASWGQPEGRGAELAVEEANAAGGIGGRQVELVTLDDQSTPQRASALAQQLGQDSSVISVLGPCCGGAALAAKPVFQAAKLPFVFGGSTQSVVTAADHDYTYRGTYPDEYNFERIVAVLKARGLSRVALLRTADAFGQGASKTLASVAAGAGVTVVSEESFNSSDADLTAQVLKVKNSSPQAILLWAYGPGAVTALKNLNQLGVLNPSVLPVFGPVGLGDDEVVGQAGDLLEGVVYASFMARDDPKPGMQTEFLQAYTKKYGGFTVSGLVGYDSAKIVLQAAKQAAGKGMVTRESVATEINSLKVDGASGTFTFSKDDHSGLAVDDVALVQVSAGQHKRYSS